MWAFFPRRKPALVYPIPPAPRTAVLSTRFRSSGAVRAFDPAAATLVADLKTFGPEAMAGTLEQLEAMAGSIRVSHAVIVLAREAEERLADSDYERLWRAFRVPAFEQVIAEDGTLLAAECEAHEGLHIESERVLRELHEIEESPCACGRDGARIVQRKRAGRRVAAAGSI